MEFSELISALGLNEKIVVATLLKPVRNGEYYKSGEVRGFKPAIIGTKVSVGFNKGHGSASYPYVLKQAKVMVVYNVGTYGKTAHFDWVPVDNCSFEVVDTNIMQNSSKKDEN